MLTFLFWNLNGKPLQATVANLVKAHEVDILVLAECGVAPATFLSTLNEEGRAQFDFPFSECAAIAIYTRFPGRVLTPLKESDRFTIRTLALPARPEILLGAAHLPSKLHRGPLGQAFGCAEFAGALREVEDGVGHRRTVLLGDLNMNPFEPGVTAAPGLNGVMTREIALRGPRFAEKTAYPFFYNPMWGLFGDGTDGPAGTYYRSSSQPETTFWNIYDQILIRPDLLPHFDNRSLRILSDDGVRNLVTKRGIPDSKEFSDHLPVMFQLGL